METVIYFRAQWCSYTTDRIDIMMQERCRMTSDSSLFAALIVPREILILNRKETERRDDSHRAVVSIKMVFSDINLSKLLISFKRPWSQPISTDYIIDKSHL